MPDRPAVPSPPDAAASARSTRAPPDRPLRRPPIPIRSIGPRALRILVAIALGAGLAILAAGCAGPGGAVAGSPRRPSAAAAEARHADVAMAAAVAAADLEAFAGHVAADGIFFGARGPAAGRAAVGIAWAPYFAPGGPRLAWTPDRAVAAPSGDLVFTFGGWTWIPAGGGPAQTGRYLTAWRRDPDGLLRAVLDGGADPLPPLPPGVRATSLRTLASADGELLAEAGLLYDDGREVGWYIRLSRRDGHGFQVIAEAGAFDPSQRR